MNSLRISSLLAGGLLALSSGSALAGGTIQVDDNKSINLGLLVQPQIQMGEILDTNGDTDYYSFDPIVRRTRIMIGGEFTKHIHFFAETDNLNIGLASTGADGTVTDGWSRGAFIQDAWVEANVNEYLQINAGMLLIPLSHMSSQSAGAIHALDYHSALVKYPAGSNLVWRDTGVMFRGLLAKKRVEYRVAITNGVDGDNAISPEINEKDRPRVTGRVQFNAKEAEGGPGAKGFFYKGIYLDKDGKKIKNAKKVISFGAALDYQADAVLDGEGKVANYMAMAGDVFVDMPIGGKAQGVTMQVNAFNYNHGEANANTGMGVAFEGGYRMNMIEPLLIVDMWDATGPTDGDDGLKENGDLMTVALGLNYWAFAHNANLKLQVGGTRKKDADTDTEDKFIKSAVLQGQLMF